MRNEKPILYIVIPCYNEESVLPITCVIFKNKILQLVQQGKIADNSRVLFVDDGSRDKTWEIIKNLHLEDEVYQGISLSRNRGHQNALFAGLMEAKKYCDISISIDCDGQDDVNVMDAMIDHYLEGCEVVYGVRNNRENDSFFKRWTAESYYRVLKLLGADIVFNHADYRLLSKTVLDALEQYREVNLFLRGMIPLVGFHNTSVYFTREKRMAGDSHYPLSKMLSLAWDGITSLSVKPLKLISALGMFVALLSFGGIIWSIYRSMTGHTIVGWTSMTCIICLLGGIQLVCIGILGEYIGKIYMETKARPRYILGDSTLGKGE